MRFDDRIATVIRQPAANAAARAAKWRQLVDLLAQAPGDSDELEDSLDYLRRYRREVGLETRREIARSLGGRKVAPALLRFFSEDHPSVAAPLLSEARLPADAWLDLLPALSPTGRALLRHRRDLTPEVGMALSSFGASDFALEGDASTQPGIEPAAEPDAEPLAEGHIRELVAKIDAFQERRRNAPAQAADDDAEGFRWETGADGIILWVEGAPREPLLGQSIAVIAGLGQFGVDGQAAGAFEKRAPFREARFRIAGEGPAAGDWRIAGVPFFARETGSFLGYRGTARRPRVDEVARAHESKGGLFGTSLPADSLRQLIHELRTPLNAIVGFAEMIDGQYMGPAGSGYRARAAEIIEQAARLLSAVDDLDTAARIETQRLTLGESGADLVALLGRLHDSYERVAAQRGALISIEISRDLPAARVDPAAAERMFARMLAATIGLAEGGEAIRAVLSRVAEGARPTLCLAIDRPRAIGGIGEAALLDPGYSPEGDWPGAPALGLGFALRLVRNLAEAAGGALVVGPMRFFLHLPAEEAEDRSSGQSG